jgi:hypothetical protein
MSAKCQIKDLMSRGLIMKRTSTNRNSLQNLFRKVTKFFEEVKVICQERRPTFAPTVTILFSKHTVNKSIKGLHVRTVSRKYIGGI